MQILTILEPSTTDLEPTSHSTDNTGLTAALVSAAMAGANPIGVNMLKAAICNDRTALDALYRQFYAVLRHLSDKRGWKYREKEKMPQRLRTMADMAIYEIIVKPPCPSCKGAKHDPENPSHKCAACNGVGRKQDSGRKYARTLEIDESTWRNTWEARYFEFIQFVQEHEYSAKRLIRKRLITIDLNPQNP